jgi:hypothetical protein
MTASLSSVSPQRRISSNNGASPYSLNNHQAFADVTRQLMRLGDVSNFSTNGRTSTSIFDDALSGKAEVASSSEESGDGSEDEQELSPLPYTMGHGNGVNGEFVRVYDRGDSSGDEYEDKKDGSFKGESDEIGPDEHHDQRVHMGAAKARTSVSAKLVMPGKLRALTKSKGKTSGATKPPMSPISLPSQSRKASSASLNFQHQLAPDEEDLSSKPRCQRCHKSKKGFDRQRPCKRCKEAGIGIEGCITEGEGNGRKGRYSTPMLRDHGRISELFAETDDSSSEDNGQSHKDEMPLPLAVSNEDDNSSIVSSNDGSIFSIESLASSATDLSKASGYSALQIATATRELVLILQDDEVLRPLYVAAIRSDIIGPQRFANNFRRLLKRFSENLKDEARDRLDYLAAQLVALKARYLAKSILEKFLEDTVVPKPTPKEMDLDLESPKKDDSSDEEEPDESNFQDLVIVREFLVESHAFQYLRSQLRQFVLPPKSTMKTQVKQDKDVSIVQSYTKINDKALLNHVKLFMPKFHFFFGRVLNGLLLQLGISEPSCPPQKDRVRWKCVCFIQNLVILN